MLLDRDAGLVHSVVFAVHCTYPQRDGQVELTPWLATKIDYLPVDWLSQITTDSSNYNMQCLSWNVAKC